MSDTPPTILSPSPLAIIARGIQDRLKLVFPPGKPFRHDFVPGKVTPEVWKQLTRTPPFIGVGWSGLHSGNGSMSELNGSSTWPVFIATVNQRGPEARYFGDDLAPGLFPLAAVGAAALHGYTIPNGGGVTVESVSNLAIEGYDDPNQAAAVIDLVVRTSIPVPAAIGNVEAADWNSVWAQYTLQDTGA